MKRFPRGKSFVALLTALIVALLLSACGTGVKGITPADAKAVGAFDLTLQSYKSGQFVLDGAVLSSLDLSSHFDYLRDQHRLPKTVLLEAGPDASIHREHLQYLASMAFTYGFTVYYADGDQLRRIVPDARNKIELRGAPQDNKGVPTRIRDAAHRDGDRSDTGY